MWVVAVAIAGDVETVGGDAELEVVTDAMTPETDSIVERRSMNSHVR